MDSVTGEIASVVTAFLSVHTLPDDSEEMDFDMQLVYVRRMLDD
jgi:hypothetical protein